MSGRMGSRKLACCQGVKKPPSKLLSSDRRFCSILRPMLHSWRERGISACSISRPRSVTRLAICSASSWECASFVNAQMMMKVCRRWCRSASLFSPSSIRFLMRSSGARFPLHRLGDCIAWKTSMSTLRMVDPDMQSLGCSSSIWWICSAITWPLNLS